MNEPTQDPAWKQQTPLDQMQVILMELDGKIMLATEGLAESGITLMEIGTLRSKLQQLLPFLNDPTLWKPFYGKKEIL